MPRPAMVGFGSPQRETGPRSPRRPRWLAWQGAIFALLLVADQACAAATRSLPYTSGPFVGLEPEAVKQAARLATPLAAKPAGGVGGGEGAAGVAGRRAQVQACLQAAAHHHGVSLALLQAIAQVESAGNPRAINRHNRNGSKDLGLMQINSHWLPQLRQWQVSEDDLFQPCISAYVGAWILAENIARLGPVWRAVGAYNARTPSLQWRYVQKVQAELARQRAVQTRSSGGRPAAAGLSSQSPECRAAPAFTASGPGLLHPEVRC